ncbi:MAG: TonB family protein [Parvibaculum sp.]|nr:TonB family protein [Parvibaculum sp.]
MTTAIVPSFDVRDYALSGDAETRKRWGRSFIVILALHASVGLAALTWQSTILEPLAPSPAIIIDMTPTPPAPTVQPKVEPVKPKELPVIEKAEVVIKKVKPKPEKPRPKPEEKLEVPPVEAKPAAPKLSEAPIEAKPAVSRNYLAVLYAHLAKYKNTPRRLGSQTREYRVKVTSRIRRDGTLLSAEIKTSSGYKKYDEAALATLRLADPMPPFPDDMKEDVWTIDVPIVYEIN